MNNPSSEASISRYDNELLSLLNASRDNRERIIRLETIVGTDPNSGLRADMAAVREEVGGLRGDVRAMEKRIYLAMGGGTVMFWLLEHYIK